MLVNTSQDCMSVKNLLPGERPATQAVVDSWESSFGALQNLDDMLEAFVPRLTCKHFVFTETGYYPVARLRTNAEVYYVFDTDTSEWIIDANLDGSGKIDYQSAPINPPTNSTFQNSPVKALSYKEMFARQWTMLPKKGEQMVKTNVVRGLFLGCIELLSIELDAQCLPGVDNYEYFHSMGKLLARSRRMYDQCFVYFNEEWVRGELSVDGTSVVPWGSPVDAEPSPPDGTEDGGSSRPARNDWLSGLDALIGPTITDRRSVFNRSLDEAFVQEGVNSSEEVEKQTLYSDHNWEFEPGKNLIFSTDQPRVKCTKCFRVMEMSRSETFGEAMTRSEIEDNCATSLMTDVMEASV